VVIAGTAGAQRLRPGTVAQRADLLSRGETGQGLDEPADMWASQPVVTVPAVGGDLEQAAVDELA
jgi:hypothetical protein